MLDRVKRDKVPYDKWWREGYVEATPGDVVDYDYILQDIEELGKKVDIKEIAFDRWGSTLISQKLMEMGGDDWLVGMG